jgi:hypothetical protein
VETRAAGALRDDQLAARELAFAADGAQRRPGGLGKGVERGGGSGSQRRHLIGNRDHPLNGR